VQSPVELVHISSCKSLSEIVVGLDGAVTCSFVNAPSGGLVICRATANPITYVEFEVDEAYCRGSPGGYITFMVGVTPMRGLDLGSTMITESVSGKPGHQKLQENIIHGGLRSSSTALKQPYAKAGDSLGVLYNSESGTITYFENGKMRQNGMPNGNGNGNRVPYAASEWCIIMPESFHHAESAVCIYSTRDGEAASTRLCDLLIVWSALGLLRYSPPMDSGNAVSRSRVAPCAA
jgi:hypothetical protein